MVPTAQLVNFVPLATFVGFYGFILVCLWKFYQIISKINDNLTGIRQAVERNAGDKPTGL
jgi:hypothetical protein